ncbi:hypothetical protein FOL47_008102 [Perkinsus chesapeaki]|uniref:Uncharacterized protein n=1 Tax=Perkinsus chesapeaki TaxID=330153 RepID=A0A7J6LG63_PERCH|nr:hypothetical protein FOL47_008102 [Perkinsus chesapeaki]
MGPLASLLVLALNIITIEAQYAFQGRLYCRKVWSSLLLQYQERMSFHPMNHHMTLEMYDPPNHARLAQGFRESDFTFDNQTNWLAVSDQSIWKKGSGFWDPKWWTKFVFHEDVDGWTVGGSAGDRWFKRC